MSTTPVPDHGDDDSDFHFSITLQLDEEGEDDDDDKDCAEIASDSLHHPPLPSVPQSLVDSFHRDGFVVFPNVVSNKAVDALNDRLEDVLRGQYDRQNKPDKVPRLLKSHKPQPTNVSSSTKEEQPEDYNSATTCPTKNNKKETGGKGSSRIGPIGFSGNLQNVKVLQIINIHKADSLFRQFAVHPTLGEVVAQLARWKDGARLAQDQVWAKPPGASALVFHRDQPYFMFEPPDVVTVWVALDDMDDELGPLEYVRGSHRWGDGRSGTANQFFQSNGEKRLLQSAAEREGLDPQHDLEIISMTGLQAGGLSIHHGKVWHGSSKNESRSRPRRGLGLHFVPANVHFTAEAIHSTLWKSYVANVEDPLLVELAEEDFPIVFRAGDNIHQ